MIHRDKDDINEKRLKSNSNKAVKKRKEVPINNLLGLIAKYKIQNIDEYKWGISTFFCVKKFYFHCPRKIL